LIICGLGKLRQELLEQVVDAENHGEKFGRYFRDLWAGIKPVFAKFLFPFVFSYKAQYRVSISEIMLWMKNKLEKLGIPLRSSEEIRILKKS